MDIDPLRPDALALAQTQIRRARNHGLVSLERACAVLLRAAEFSADPIDDAWLIDELRQWRALVGYQPTRPPQTWTLPGFSGLPCLAERLTAAGPVVPADDVERVTDLLWLGELADALAVTRGQPLTRIDIQGDRVAFTRGPARIRPRVRGSRLVSIPDAVVRVATLVRIGAALSAGATTWTSLVDGVDDDATATTAERRCWSPGRSSLPGWRSSTGSELPGTSLRIKFAKRGNQLAGWGQMMGNCIASYASKAEAGECALAALIDPTGRMRANLSLVPCNDVWTLKQLRGPHNAACDPEVIEAVVRWVEALPPVEWPTTRRRIRQDPGPDTAWTGAWRGERPAPAGGADAWGFEP